MTIIKKFEPEEPKKKFSRRYIFSVALSLFALIIVEVWASNTVVTYGEKYQKLSSLQKTLLSENQLLENKIAQFAALNNIASKSSELGFSKTLDIQYIR